MVIIYCNDASSIKGNVYINEGERMLDFINDKREKFIAVTEAEFSCARDIRQFRLLTTDLCKSNRNKFNPMAVPKHECKTTGAFQSV